MADISLVELIKSKIEADDTELPVFNKTAMALQQELAKPDPSIQAIEKQIVQDQALTGQVLRMANSSFYRGMQEVTTIRNAIIRLGANEVANIVAVATQKVNFKAKDPFVREFMDKLFAHSVGCAVGANWLAKQIGDETVLRESFFAGLLHDIGKLFLFKVIEDLKKEGRIDSSLSKEFTEDVVYSMHCEQGSELLTRWNLPESYRRVAKLHHEEEFDESDVLLAVVRLADKACHKNGIGFEKDPAIDIATSLEAGMLELSEVRLAELEIKIEDAMGLIGAVNGG